MTLSITLIALGSLGLFIFGIRGIRAGSSPHCRSCGYDLAGIDSPTTCPECGRDVSQPKAVRRGGLRRKPVLAGVCVIVLLSGATMLGYRAVIATGNLPPSARPVWLLKIDARSDQPARAESAADELYKRYIKKEVDDATLASLIDIALDYHADASYEWTGSPYMDVLVASNKNGLLTDAQMERYRENVFTGLDVQAWEKRYRTRPGETIATRSLITDGMARVLFDEYVVMLGYPTELTREAEPVELVHERAEDGEGWLVRTDTIKWRSDMRGRGSRPGEHTHEEKTARFEFTAPEEGGVHTYTGESVAELYLLEHDGPGMPRNVSQILEREPTEVREIGSEFTVHVIEVPSDVLAYVDSTTDVPAPNIAPDWGTNDPGPHWRISVSHDEGWLRLDGALVRMSQPGDAAHVASDMYIVADGQRFPLSDKAEADSPPETVQFNAMEGSLGSSAGKMKMGYLERGAFPRTETVDVILVPNAWLAAEESNADVFWNEEIVLEDVPIDWSNFDTVTRSTTQEIVLPGPTDESER